MSDWPMKSAKLGAMNGFKVHTPTILRTDRVDMMMRQNSIGSARVMPM
jgi:hypothetical protein